MEKEGFAILPDAIVFLPALFSLRTHESRPMYVEIREISPEMYSLQWRVPPTIPDRRDRASTVLRGYGFYDFSFDHSGTFGSGFGSRPGSDGGGGDRSERGVSGDGDLR